VPRGNGHAFRAALDAQYRFRPDQPIGPWLGLRGGLEWLTLDTVTYRGFPFVDADVGVTVLARDASTMGFYLGLALGRFVHADDSVSAFTGSGSGFGGFPPPPSRTIDDPAWHGWVELGVRGTVDF
jgi:hypothetical protein